MFLNYLGRFVHASLFSQHTLHYSDYFTPLIVNKDTMVPRAKSNT
uniref:Uncharacterized protein n=1 Tax=Anguilla anguilla TaxID=7936 RepID=A0A0E9TES6_ANGAN